QKTKIGVYVNELRKNPNATDDQKATAKELVGKWKNDVGRGEKSGDGGDSKSAAKKPIPPKVDTEKKAVVSPSVSQVSTPASGEYTERSLASDNIKVSSTTDKLRERCIGMLYTSLASGTQEDSRKVLSIAEKIENITNDTEGQGSQKYKTRIRSMWLNLKDKTNPFLRQRVLSGSLAVEQFAVMTTEEMASNERRNEADKARKQSMNEATAAVDNQAETDMFKCGRCGQRKTKYYQKQTRSADEPMTTFVTCVNCDNKWKFC
ncbi:transcription factor S-II, central domain-containing protein, partial [Blyttiomyces helicus]